LREPAAEFGAIKLKVVAKHIKQRRIGLGRHRSRCTVDLQANGHVLGISLLTDVCRPLISCLGLKAEFRAILSVPGQAVEAEIAA
jgi:hypothetical protein